MSALSGTTQPTQINRTMFFIDGQNLAIRFKNMKKVRKAQKGIVEVKDIFVWKRIDFDYPPRLSRGISSYDIVRAYYYTYFTGSEDDKEALELKIKSTPVEQTGPQTLLPKVFKKARKEAQAKGDDIALTVEALHHAYNHNVDIVHIFTGDGDYLPLVQEIKHLGVLVYLSAFSEGLNPKLKLEADYFIELDDLFFEE